MWNDSCRELRIRFEAVKVRREVANKSSGWWRFDGALGEKLACFLVVEEGIDLPMVMISVN